MKTRSNFRDLTGQRFGRLLIIARMPNLSNTPQSIWHGRCDCGVEKFALASGALLKGRTQSCGCLRKELAKYRGPDRYLKGNRNPLYVTYCAMRQRCLDVKSKAYPNYGGRGITMCQRWLESFESFVDDMGERPKNCSIDRIDNSGNYEPGNCRWADAVQQSQNRRPNARLLSFEWNGEDLCLKEICRRENVSYHSIRRFMRLGYTLYESVRRTRNFSVFVESSKVKKMEPSYTPNVRKPRPVKPLKAPKPARPTKSQVIANGKLKSNEENERRKEDIWLRGCMERCAKSGLTYRGKLPSDFQNS